MLQYKKKSNYNEREAKSRKAFARNVMMKKMAKNR